MNKKIIVIVFLFMLMTLSGIALVKFSYSADQLAEEVRELETNIAKEKDSIKVLIAEWNYSTRPDRLHFLTRDILPEFSGISISQVYQLKDLPEIINLQTTPAKLKKDSPHSIKSDEPIKEKIL